MIKLLQGDYLQLMESIQDESIDVIFTDPPYKLIGGGRKNSLLRNNNRNSPFNTSGECFNYKTPNFNDWIPSLFNKLKIDRYLFIMTNDRNMKQIWNLSEKSGFIFCEILVMNKKIGVPSTYFYKSCEFVLMFRKGNYRKFNKFGIKNVFDVEMPRGKNKLHPTQKPIKMIEDIINCVTLKDEVVFDPFMGSGSTGVACKNTNRSFIGIEKDKEYFNIAEKRINDEVLN